MNLTYSKLRKVLSLFLKNPILRDGLQELISGKEQELDELGFLDLLDKSQVDLELLEILTEKKASDILADDAIGVFADFFCSIKASWQKLKPLLSSLGLKVETSLTSTSKG
jgi:hypothetical protein